MNQQEFIEYFQKADELTKQAIEALVKYPRKYDDLFANIKDGKKLRKAILARAYQLREE